MERKIRDIPDYDRKRGYYVGSGGRVMSFPLPRGKPREEDMAPIVRKKGAFYFVRDGALYEKRRSKE